jgi:hypothetical protein
MKNKYTNTHHTPSQSINNSQKKIKERNRRCMLKEEHEVRQAIIDGAAENREKMIREAEEVLLTGAKPPKKRTHTTLQRMQEPANRLVQNTDPQEYVAAALVSGMTPTACLQLPVATDIPGRTQEYVSTSTVRLMPTTCLQLPVTITTQPLATSTVTPTKIVMLHDNQPEDPVSDKDEKQEEEDSEFVLDADGNTIFAYEMAMNKRVKSNMERLKRLDLLKFVPEKAPSPKKTIKEKRKKSRKQTAAPRKTR